jgi:hypothetical protein
MEETPARIDRVIRDLLDLRSLAGGARTRFARGKGRPANLPLRAALGVLATDWESLTGQEPTRLWHQGEPVSPFARFATTVIEHIDADAVQHIATVTKKHFRPPLIDDAGRFAAYHRTMVIRRRQ